MARLLRANALWALIVTACGGPGGPPQAAAPGPDPAPGHTTETVAARRAAAAKAAPATPAAAPPPADALPHPGAKTPDAAAPRTGSPLRAHAQQPADVQPRTDAAPRVYRSAWDALPTGATPPELADVRGEGWSFPWLYHGAWRIERHGDQAVLAVPFAKTEPYEPLTFRRYTGDTFGPDGALPRHYRVTAEARSNGGSTRFGGFGEVAIQAFYVSPTTYLEVLQTDRHLCLWEARNAPPMQGKGWRLIARVPRPQPIGAWFRLEVEIDREAGEVIALRDGKPVARGRSPLLTGDHASRLTLRATGNREDWRWLEVREIR